MQAVIRRLLVPLGASIAAALFAAAPARAQFGLAVAGVGPINRSMGGAATGAPLDAAGAIYWNPATMGALGKNEMVFGVEFLAARSTLTSKLPAGSIQGILPRTTLAGRDGGNNGVFPLPTFGVVWRPDDPDSRWTFGLGAFEVGGFGVNYPASPTNPVLSVPPAPRGFGVGSLYTQYQVFQFSPSVSYRVTDEVSVGLQANGDLGSFNVDPALFTRPAFLAGPGGRPFPVYPPATHGRYRGGGGFQAGVYYAPEDSDWNFGASVKSPQWFETYTFNTVDPATGRPGTAKFNLDFPLIASVGTSYSGIDRLLLALDLRFVNYRDTNGFKRTGFDPATLALRGLGWQNVFALAFGSQYKVTDDLSLRAGYTFSLNPAGDSTTSFNIGSPTIIQHTLALGASYNLTRAVTASLAYVHDFENSITGPIILPDGSSPRGSKVRSATTADAVIAGISVVF